jgi:alpha-L-arabinofuranosidase
VDPLDFDEFMGVCREVGAEPYVVTAYEACRWPPMPGWKPPSLEQLLSTASAWVRYANKTRSYGVRYWEIGNETWLKNETWSNHISAAAYAADLVEFSRRMKAEDPSIQIGANGDSDNWWREVLQRAAPHIDFMSVHSYPCWKWTGYEDYRTNSLDILGVVRTATNALAKYAPAHQRRIRIALTEFAAGTFGDWDKTPADLGRALITFDLQGQLLACPEVAFSHFWTTHNIYTDVNGDVFETLKRDNSLSPIGRALWIWNHFLGDEMLATTSAPSIRCYASRRAGQELSLFLVNKELSSCVIDVSLKNLPGDSWRAEQWTLSGTGAGDRNPTWREAGPIRVSNSRVSPRLEPVSVMVIRVSKEPSPRKPVR